MKKQYIIVATIFLIAIISIAFYWYEYRPTKIRKFCNTKSQETNTGTLNEFLSIQAAYDENYKKCLRDNGLEK